jgi:hypothetical protein
MRRTSRSRFETIWSACFTSIARTTGRSVAYGKTRIAKIHLLAETAERVLVEFLASPHRGPDAAGHQEHRLENAGLVIAIIRKAGRLVAVWMRHRAGLATNTPTSPRSMPNSPARRRQNWRSSLGDAFAMPSGRSPGQATSSKIGTVSGGRIRGRQAGRCWGLMAVGRRRWGRRRSCREARNVKNRPKTCDPLQGCM